MATNKYRITVKNKSPITQSLLLFSDLPIAKLSQNVTDPYVNVWMKPVLVPGANGRAEFDITAEQFAVCGTTPTPLAQGVVVSTGDFTPVTVTSAKPGTKAIAQVDDQGGVVFVPPAGTTEVAHAFGIDILPHSPTDHLNIFCGFGKRGQNGQVVPVAVWPATPCDTFTIIPNVTYYIGTGSTA